MDGHFVPNMTFGSLVIKALQPPGRGSAGLHLMIEGARPLRRRVRARRSRRDPCTSKPPAPAPRRSTLNLQAPARRPARCSIRPRLVGGARRRERKQLDFVVVMAVNPGFGGQAFIPHSIDKVARLRTMSDRAVSRFRSS